MNTAIFLGSLVVAGCLLLPPTAAGTFKRIVIDGNMEDWAGVPVAYTDAQDSTGAFDIRDVYIANDEQYLYLRVTLYAPADYGAHNHHVFIDRDADVTTGAGFVGVGSEMMIENGSGYQQKNGGFNEGGASGLDWAAAPSGVVTQYEARIARSVKDAEGQPLFTQDLIALALQVQNSDWNVIDDIPVSDAGFYEFAAPPSPFTGTATLVNLTQTSWQFHDTGVDPGAEWLNADYDDQQAGWSGGTGLFGFGAPAGVYPAPVASTLSSGSTTYYFRTRFTWSHDVSGVALVVSNYVSDGVVVYLNGAEARRLRLPDGALAASTPATGGPANPGQAEVFGLVPEGLIVGENLLQVEVHQAAATPAELVFGLSLTASDAYPPVLEDPSQPVDRTVVEGEATTFEAGRVVGTPPLTYQWLKDGVAIPGATDATLTIAPVLVGDAGRYSVEITNAKGQKVTSRAAELRTTGVPVSIIDPALPADLAVVEGTTATLGSAIAGSPVLTYQWYKDDAAVPGAEGPQLVLDPVRLSDAGTYWVTAGNRLNTVTSRHARLTVQRDVTPPTIARLAGSARKLRVTFSEVVDPAVAEKPSIYQLNGGLTVQGAAVDPADARTVTLTTSAQTFGTAYLLTVTGIKDLFGNAGNTAAPFRSAIVIDGDFEDWAGIPVLQSEPQDTPEGIEFKDFYVANDNDYLYLRFSFYAPVGPLPVDHFYHINLDADGDFATGRAYGGLGLEVMIENGTGYQQKGGGFNEGTVANLDFALAPETKSTDFECRISRRATYNRDGLPVFTTPSIALVFDLISSGWSLVELAPAGGLPYTFNEFPPLNPGPLNVALANGQIEISWPGGGTLESRTEVNTGAWATVTGATSPYRVPVGDAHRYYRLRQ